MEKIIISKAEASDVITLQQLAKQTFAEAFSATNNAESMSKYLEEGFSEEKLKAELDHQDSQFYFAIHNERPVGYLKVNTGSAQTELIDENALEIERIYVLSEYHGKKVGQLLYEKAVAIAQQRNASYVWLGVWEENPRAISFYKKNGFFAFDKHIFKLGDEEQTDIMMKKTL